MNAISEYLFTHAGKQYVARLYRDDDMGPPWSEHDLHGIVSKSRNESTRALGNGFQYDFDATLTLAKSDQWGLGDDEKQKLAATLGRAPTADDVTAEAVRLDFERMRAWVRDEWHWCGVSVVRVNAYGTIATDEFKHAIWGIESDSDYWKDVAHDCAEEVQA